MFSTISHVLHIMFFGFECLGIAFAVLAVAVCWRALRMTEGR